MLRSTTIFGEIIITPRQASLSLHRSTNGLPVPEFVRVLPVNVYFFYIIYEWVSWKDPKVPMKKVAFSRSDHRPFTR